MQLYASYLLLKNHLSHNNTVQNQDLDVLRINYTLYLDHYAHDTIMKLKPHEEILILKNLLADKFEASRDIRLKELDINAARKLRMPNKVKQKETKRKDLTGFNWYELTLSSEKAC